MQITNSIRDNLYIQQVRTFFRENLSPKYSGIKKFEKRFRQTDSIRDYEKFAELVRQMKKGNKKLYLIPGRFTQARYYGYFEAFKNYSGYTPKHKFPVITGIEHGVRFGGDKWKVSDHNTGFLCMSDNRISEVREKKINLPVYPIGPYINYAEDYYSEEETAEIKKQLGKTLLVFLSHTCEWHEECKSQDVADYVYEKYGKDFDTVMVCVYWNDVDCDQAVSFMEKGAKLVSAGYRSDPSFVKRLKTIIGLSDYVVGNDIGTNIGFALSMGKTFELLGTCRAKENDEVFTKNYRRLYDAFSLKGETEFTEKQLEEQRCLYREFWGGDSFQYSREDAYRLLEGMDRIISLSHESLNNYKKKLAEIDGILPDDEVQAFKRGFKN